jgi:hypothetical protein
LYDINIQSLYLTIEVTFSQGFETTEEKFIELQTTFAHKTQISIHFSVLQAE